MQYTYISCDQLGDQLYDIYIYIKHHMLMSDATDIYIYISNITGDQLMIICYISNQLGLWYIIHNIYNQYMIYMRPNT